MAPHSSTLAWKIPWTEEPGRLQSMGSLRESDTTGWLHFHFSLSCIGEGNGSPLQCSCLENPRDGGAWRAAVSGVAQSRTWLKRLSSSSVLFGDCVAYSEASFQLKVDHCSSLQLSWTGSLLFLFLEFSHFSCGLHLHSQNNNNKKPQMNWWIESSHTRLWK